MKRQILSLLTLALTFVGFNANAQSFLDLSVSIQGIDTNHCFHADSTFSADLILNVNGSDTIPTGAQFICFNSFESKFDSSWLVTPIIYDYDTAQTFTFKSFNNVNGSTIESLIDIDSFMKYGPAEATVNRIITFKNNFVTGKSYFLYANVMPVEDSLVIDTVGNNNFTILPIVWECTVDSTGNTDSNNTRINGVVLPSSISVYPNPANNNINVKYDFGQATPATISIFDMSGRVVYSENHSAINGVQQLNINVEDITNGIYFIRIQTNAKTSVGKFTISR